MTSSHRATSPRERLFELIDGYRTTCLLTAALRLGLIEQLAAAPADEESLARALEAHLPSLRRFVRALGVIGLTERRENGDIALTALGRGLSRSESALCDRAILAGEQYLPGWANLEHSVRTGETGFGQVFDMSVWRHREVRPELSESFNRIMVECAARSDHSLLDAFDFSDRARIIDVGGGHGQGVAGLLQLYPTAEGVLFDEPHVVEGAAHFLEASGVLDRCSVETGSFFDAVPGGGDVYLLRYVLHDWDDEGCMTILRNCRAAMKRSSALLIVEQLIPEDPETPVPASLAMLDLHMMAVLGGRERTRSDYEMLLEKAGLRLVRCTPADSTAHVIEASASEE